MKKTLLTLLMALLLTAMALASVARVNVEDRVGMKNMVLVEKGDESFWINRYEVTYGDYHRFNSTASLRYYRGDEYPVVDMSYLLATRYCNWLSRKEGLQEAYDSDGNLLDKNGRYTDDVMEVEGYRLPTAWEWTYAAQGGTKSRDYTYAGSNDLNQVGWYDENSGGETHPVGQKQANELGLFDMSGNALEWTETVKEKSPEYNIVKGGSVDKRQYLCEPENAYVASNGIGGYPTKTMGFRIAKTKTDEEEQNWGNRVPTPADDEIIVFTEFFFNGEYKVLKKGTYCDSEAIGLRDNSISSIRIGKDMKVIIYEHNMLNGNRYIYPRDEDGNRDIETVEDYFNKQISSLVVIRDGESVDSGDCDGEKNEPERGAVDAGGMVLIPSGTFEMGDEVGDLWDWERPVHEVRLTYDYWMGKYEVTNGEYVEFLNSAGVDSDGEKNGIEYIDIDIIHYDIEYRNGRFMLKESGKVNYPVIDVTWYGAVAYCNWLSWQKGLPEAYEWDSGQNTYRLSDYPDNTGYRLPTEAEWEYAARGGQSYKYAGSDDLDEVGWYEDNSQNARYAMDNGRGTQEVGQKKANGYGLYDMSGNVSEWCSDNWYDYPDYTDTNPYYQEPKNTGSSARMIRGGSWCSVARYCRVAGRDYDSNSGAGSYDGLGFRIARTR